MAIHFNSTTGVACMLKAGDTVTIEDTAGNRARFRVLDSGSGGPFALVDVERDDTDVGNQDVEPEYMVGDVTVPADHVHNPDWWMLLAPVE